MGHGQGVAGGEDGALPGGDGGGGGVLLPRGRGQHRQGTPPLPPTLLGHLIVPGVEILLSLAQSLLQEGGLASAPRPTSESCEIKVQLQEGNETCQEVSLHFCAKAKS